MNPFTPKVRAVIRREFMERVKSKWFLLSTLGLPLAMVALMGFAGFMAVRGQTDTDVTRAIGVADASGALGETYVEELLADSLLASRAEAFDALDETEARTRLAESPYDYLVLLPDGLLDMDPDADDRPDVKVLARDNVPEGTSRTMRDALRRALLRGRLAASGVESVDTDALLATASWDVVTVSDTGEARSQDLLQVVSFVIAFFFYMILILYGQMIIRSVIEEKATDIVEVMVSSLRPWELMLGKIVGVGAVGLTQIAIWALILSLAATFGLTAGAAALAEAGIDASTLSIPWGTVILVLLFLALGYLLFAGMFAGAGATISNEQDAQQAALPVMMLIIVPFIAIQGLIGSPNAGWAVVMSLIPFFSPLVMTSRVIITSVPVWQWALSLALLVAAGLAVAWIAGRIYRVGVLMKGQRANLPEVIRWIRHG